MKILIVEDTKHLAEAIEHILKKNKYQAETVSDGEAGFDYAVTGIYDLILLDIMLPKMDGITVLKKLRAEKITTPIILLTAKGEVSDKVKGLDSGADDYLAKPFSTEELMARIRAVTRRKGEVVMQHGVLCFGDIELNTNLLKLSKGASEVKLTLKESEMLELLINRKNMISSKELIIEKLWGFSSFAEHNNVEVYISFLRKKLVFLKSNISIATVRGAGYLLESN